MNTIDLGYSTSLTKSYWCHICKREFNKIFIENVDVQCQSCGGNFCEEITSSSNDHPSNFQPYEAPRTSTRNDNSIMSMIYMPRGLSQPRTSSSFLDMIINVLGMNRNDDSNMESIINFIMQNDPNRYGNPPAGKKAMESLEKFEMDPIRLDKMSKEENSCSVCKDEFEIKQQVIALPCKHYFHEECIIPWFKERNSCPTCRYELPTDDSDYEARKNTI